MALGREGRYSDDRVVKWCGPTGIRLPDALAGERRRRVLEALESLSGLTAVDFRMGSEPGIEVHYPLSSTERQLITASLPAVSPAGRRRLESSRCFFVIQSESRSGCLTRADVLLPDELEEPDFNHCVAEELSQVMGLPNDLDAGEGMLFSRTGQAPGRTAVDDLFLRVLYDPALKPGSARKELDEIVPELIRKYR